MDGFAEPAGVDPNHRVGFSQLFAGSQFSAASARPSVDVTQPGVDPNHRIGFSQLFAGSQASADVRHPQGSSTQPGIDPKHKVGFSQLFAGSQAEFSGFGSADVTQANRHDPSVPIEPRAAESQDSADSMKIHLAYEDSLPLDNPLPAPDEPEPGPAFIADPIPPKPAPPNKDAIKAMKLKQVNKEKAKVEAVKALGKKGTDILSLFAKQQAKAKPSEETALSRAESDNEEDARGTQSEEVGAQDSERDDLEPDSRGEEGGSAGEDSDEGGSDGEEEGGDGEDSNADDSETETDAGVESEQPASEAAAGTSSALPSGPVGEDDEDEPIFKPKPKKGKSMYIVQEAEEEEDEFQGLGGPDGDDSDEDDGKDLADLIATGKDAVDAKPEDFETILRQHRADDAVKDQQELEQLLKDVTAGNLRKRRTDLSGRYLDDDDEDDADLEILLDMRRAADLARRYDTGKRKRGEEMSALEKLGWLLGRFAAQRSPDMTSLFFQFRNLKLRLLVAHF